SLLRCSPSLRHYPLGLGTPQAMKNKSKKQSWRKTSCAPYLTPVMKWEVEPEESPEACRPAGPDYAAQ
ncbi:mCG1046397, isoform CRA_b, partial [Mus musculus]